MENKDSRMLLARHQANRLQAIENANRNMLELDMALQELGHGMLYAEIRGNQSHRQRLLIRQSVSQGVRRMFHHYSNNQIEQLSRFSQEVDDESLNDTIATHMTSSMTSPAPSTNDMTACSWMQVHCQQHRGN